MFRHTDGARYTLCDDDILMVNSHEEESTKGRQRCLGTETAAADNRDSQEVEADDDGSWRTPDGISERKLRVQFGVSGSGDMQNRCSSAWLLEVEDACDGVSWSGGEGRRGSRKRQEQWRTTAGSIAAAALCGSKRGSSKQDKRAAGTQDCRRVGV
jgi:hypothetical protein